MTLAKLREVYNTIALLILSTLILVILLNVILAVAFSIRDQTSVAPKAKGELKSDGLFNSVGAPVDNAQRSAFQLTWFDYTAYEKIVDERYAGTVLDDFFHLGKLGFIYQPWVQFSEPPYSGKLVNVDVDAKGFPVRRTLNPEKNRSPVIRIFALGGSTP